MKCTWESCTAIADNPQTGTDGQVWAHLCKAHNDELNNSLDGTHPRVLVANWIKAQGGAKIAADRIMRTANYWTITTKSE